MTLRGTPISSSGTFLLCCLCGIVAAHIVLDPPPANFNGIKRRSYIYSLDSGGSSSEKSPRRLRRGSDDEHSPEQATPEQLASSNVTALLNGLFNQYNKTFRPGYGHGPTQVLVNMVLISMGPISELNSDYSLDMYFRQKWRDERLRFNGSEGMRELALNNLMLEDIWKPDTFFQNGKEYYVHTITTANKLLRLKTTGEIVYSMRLRITARCQMKLTFYPVDTQLCPLVIGSFGHRSHEVLYSWDPAEDNPVRLEKQLSNSSLAQFDLSTPIQFENIFALFQSGMKKENYSMVRADFQLKRRIDYFLLQIYLPCILIVVLSWVSFWLNREATERLSLGIMAFLTLANMNQDEKNVLPKMSYPTALEWYILICNLYVSASILQFAGVHFFTKTGFEEHSLPKDADQRGDDDWEDIPASEFANALERFSIPKVMAPAGSSNANYRRTTSGNIATYSRRGAGHVVTSNEERFANETACQKFWYCFTGNEDYRSELLRRGKVRSSTVNSVSFLDRASRVGFPVSFILVNVFYWTSFLYAEAPKKTPIGSQL